MPRGGRARPAGRRYLLCPAVSAYCSNQAPMAAIRPAMGAFLAAMEKECHRQRAPRRALAAFSSSARWASRLCGLVIPCRDDKAALCGFQPMAGPPEGKTAQPPAGRAGWITQPAALPQSRKADVALCLLRPIPRKKTAPAPLYGGAGRAKAGRNLAARGTAFRPHRGSAPKAYGRLKSGAALVHNTLFDGAAAARPCFASRSVISVAGALSYCGFFFFFFTEKPKSPILRPSAKYSPCA